ncbi:unnamed protein product [Amoebophrya sp. A25]|nr:unnamed protein product [Amoebophrya sp. A25]|eukprot:GSA25T00013635001.1
MVEMKKKSILELAAARELEQDSRVEQQRDDGAAAKPAVKSMKKKAMKKESDSQKQERVMTSKKDQPDVEVEASATDSAPKKPDAPAEGSKAGKRNRQKKTDWTAARLSPKDYQFRAIKKYENADEAGKKRIVEENEKKYHMIRFFERKRVEKNLDRARKQVVEAMKKPEKDQDQEDQARDVLQQCEADKRYVTKFPAYLPYLSLFPKQDSPESSARREYMREYIDNIISEKRAKFDEETSKFLSEKEQKKGSKGGKKGAKLGDGKGSGKGAAAKGTEAGKGEADSEASTSSKGGKKGAGQKGKGKGKKGKGETRTSPENAAVADTKDSEAKADAVSSSEVMESVKKSKERLRNEEAGEQKSSSVSNGNLAACRDVALEEDVDVETKKKKKKLQKSAETAATTNDEKTESAVQNKSAPSGSTVSSKKKMKPNTTTAQAQPSPVESAATNCGVAEGAKTSDKRKAPEVVGASAKKQKKQDKTPNTHGTHESFLASQAPHRQGAIVQANNKKMTFDSDSD